jgi:hypothetical protein
MYFIDMYIFLEEKENEEGEEEEEKKKVQIIEVFLSFCVSLSAINAGLLASLLIQLSTRESETKAMFIPMDKPSMSCQDYARSTTNNNTSRLDPIRLKRIRRRKRL